jgi:hydrogenase maturation protease
MARSVKPAPVLVIGLGNPLMGDDGIGWHVAEHLRNAVEVLEGGTDLLRCWNQLEGREHVIVVDALLDDAGLPGEVVVITGAFDGFDNTQPHAHGLSAMQAIELLRTVAPARVTVAAVRIPSAGIHPGLSPALAAQLPRIAEEVLACASQCPAEL